jgi:hypothetical protein
VTWDQALLLVMLVVLAVAAWAGVFFVIPWCQQSRYRSRLWLLRDQITDDMINGVLPTDDAVLELRTWIEGHIRYVKDFKLSNFILAIIIRKTSPLPPMNYASRADLTPDELALLQSYEARFLRMQTRQLFAGTPFGWLASPGVLLSAILAPRKASKAHRVVERTVQRPDVTGRPELWVPERHLTPDDRKKEAAACVG